MRGTSKRRRFLAPEVLQTSSVDCGPACLRSMLLGFGLDVPYEQVRAACGTGVGGSSMSRMETVAQEEGLAAEQVWMPADHLTLRHRTAFPAICVSQRPGTSPHFTLVWRRVGRWYQVMDPNAGRRWVDAEGLRSINHRYNVDLPAQRWRAWMGSDDYAEAIAERLAEVGANIDLYRECIGNPATSVATLCAFDAAVRMVSVLAQKGAVRPGPTAVALIRELWAQAQHDALSGSPTATIPEEFYSGVPDQTLSSVRLVGAIVLRFRGVSGAALGANAGAGDRRPHPVSRSTFQVVREAMAPASVPKGLLACVLACVTAFSAYIVAFLVRAYTNADGAVLGFDARVTFVAVVLLVLVSSAAIELWWRLQVRALGRMLDVRLRIAFVERLRELRRSFLRTRPASDISHRVHLATFVRNIPELIGQGWSTLCSLLLATGALLYLFPGGRMVVLATLIAAIMVPTLAHRSLVEKDGKLRAQNSRLAQFNLDALLGAKTVAAHGARHALRWAHSRIVDDWAHAARERLRILVSVEFVLLLFASGSAIAIVWRYATRPESSPAILLVAFWALAIPRLSESLLALARALPAQRSVLGRLAEPIAAGDPRVLPPAVAVGGHGKAGFPAVPELHLGVPAKAEHQSTRRMLVAPAASADHQQQHAVARTSQDPMRREAQTPGHDVEVRSSTNPSLVWKDVSYQADHHNVLQDVDLHVPAGSHVAIVGPSGSGKSTLLSLALGWNTPTGGSILLDGRATAADELRARVGWLDPEVTLWDDTVLENIRYGSPNTHTDVAEAVAGADLHGVLARRPLGFHTRAGESGRCLSGGEAQRVRLARTLSNADSAGIIVLDEPFRGLSRDARQDLMGYVRGRWRDRTVLCATHDIKTACDFDRVLVVEDGRVVEDGDPQVLLRGQSALARLLEAEEAAFESIWNASIWRHLRIEDGRLAELPPSQEDA